MSINQYLVTLLLFCVALGSSSKVNANPGGMLTLLLDVDKVHSRESFLIIVVYISVLYYEDYVLAVFPVPLCRMSSPKRPFKVALHVGAWRYWQRKMKEMFIFLCLDIDDM